MARNDFKGGGEFLSHSYKGTTWKDHSYIRKEMRNGKWVYYYGPNERDYADTRKGAEYKAAERRSNYNITDSDSAHWDSRKQQMHNTNQQRHGKKANYDTSVMNTSKDYYGKRKQKIQSDANERYGGNGMPSSVATLMREHGNEQLDDVYRKYAHKGSSHGNF